MWIFTVVRRLLKQWVGYRGVDHLTYRLDRVKFQTITCNGVRFTIEILYKDKVWRANVWYIVLNARQAGQRTVRVGIFYMENDPY